MKPKNASVDVFVHTINKMNVGRIAERIVSNELEYLGFRVSDLNADSTSANADLLAVGHGKTWQIQVKGATNAKTDKYWWVQYGHCNDEMIKDRKSPMFNRHTSFYSADFVVLVAVRSPKEYCCIVLPTAEAERAVQLNFDGYFRLPKKKDGGQRKPAKMWAHLDVNPRSRTVNEWRDKEQALLNRYRDKWEILL